FKELPIYPCMPVTQIFIHLSFPTKVAMAKVIKAFKLKPDCHCTSKYLNNLIEQDHRHIKVRKTRYQSINTAKNTLKGIECIYALYKKNRRSLQIYGFSPCHEISIMLAS
ncbi:DDE-type integrase/transposase/recombinase, partial [Staphylococcus aureus]|uniref:DDE-type integrase/transposase/recombinase n=1 Tax=Staphylococcus aureus TaxID=1280 RepID=UPI001F19F8FA